MRCVPDVFDTSFDTNPKQRRETSRNTETSISACLGVLRNDQKRLETYRPRLKIMVSPVRVRVPPHLFSKHLQKSTHCARWFAKDPSSALLRVVGQQSSTSF